jgi:hypothetical protein
MNNETFWLLTLLILCIGFSIQPLRELWRKLRPVKESQPVDEAKPVLAPVEAPLPEEPPPSKPIFPVNPREAILRKYNIPRSYLGYLSRLNNEELEDWAKAFYAANADRRWQ